MWIEALTLAPAEPIIINACAKPESSKQWPGWTKVEVGVDSCAAANVCNRDHLPLSLFNSSDQRPEHGQEYSCADDGRLYNEGEKRVSGVTDEGERLNVEWQVTQVSRPLLSVTKLSEAGYSTSFDDTGGVIRSKRTGKTIRVHKRHGIYVVDLWVPPRSQGADGSFGRQR